MVVVKKIEIVESFVDMMTKSIPLAKLKGSVKVSAHQSVGKASMDDEYYDLPLNIEPMWRIIKLYFEFEFVHETRPN